MEGKKKISVLRMRMALGLAFGKGSHNPVLHRALQTLEPAQRLGSPRGNESCKTLSPHPPLNSRYLPASLHHQTHSVLGAKENRREAPAPAQRTVCFAPT